MDNEYSPSEMMVIAGSRLLRDGERILVGVGIPNLAANLALRTTAPNAVLIYESGVVGSIPIRLPLSIADACLVSNSQSIFSMIDLFGYILQNGLIDVGFLGGAQIDRFGNINSTIIGDYLHPKARLPGAGGASAIAVNAKRTIIITPHQKRRFPERVDFITSPGFPEGRENRKKLGMIGGGPEAVVTDLGIMEFDEKGEMILASIHPGIEVENVVNNTGWQLKISNNLAITKPPEIEELRLIREVLDPQKIYLS